MSEMPQCPGCHIGCSLAVPGCGRGIDFAARVRAGEEIPERNPFGHGPAKGADGEKSPGRGSAHAAAGSPTGSADSSSAKPARRGPNPAEHLMTLLSRILPDALNTLDGMSADDETVVLQWIARMEGRMARRVMPARIRAVDDAALDVTLANLIEAECLEIIEVEGRQYFAITDAGRERADAFELEHERAVARVLEGLDEGEAETMIALCHKILEAARK